MGLTAGVVAQVEDGVWMQVHLVADRLYGNNRPRASMELPQTYFEIWRQNEDSLVQVLSRSDAPS